VTDTEIGPVGFVGLGHMGAPMSRRLLASGFEVVGFDVSGTATRCVAVDGVQVAGDLAEVARRCTAVVVMLPHSDVVEEVLLDGELLATMAAGSMVIDMGSSAPRRTQYLAQRAYEYGHTLVDAPVSGGVAAAETGTLTAMLGGDPTAVERARRIVEVLASRVFHAGEVGAGHAVKALNNLMSATHLMVTSEALIAARAFGLDPRLALDVINESSGRSGSTQNKWPNFILPGTFDSGFSLRLMLKDMRTALDLVHSAGASAPLSESSVALWARAAEELPPAADHTEIARWIDSRTELLPDGEDDDHVRR
jgi:3-hydroxyisobutyrate dehydrogenase